MPSIKRPPNRGKSCNRRTTTAPEGKRQPFPHWTVRKTLAAIVVAIAPACHATAQPVKIPPEQLNGKTAATVVPGAGYRAGKAGDLLLGSNWRALWNTPVEVPLLDLRTYAGGITPLEKGGDQLAETLLFKGANGKEYLFRSLDKDPSRGLSPKIRGTPLETFIREGASSLNPVAELILAPILDAAGVYHVSPRLVLMPYDHEQLREFSDEFAGIPGIIGENPTGSDRSGTGFMGARRIAGTDEVMRELDRDNGNEIDARAYLRARLVDILVGDGDRWPDQWLWAGYGDSGHQRWVAVPIRQYQAFSRKTGPVSAIPRIQDFGAGYPKIRDLARSGGMLDRRILAGLDRSEWEAVTLELKRKLTDQVIAEAVRQMPPEMYSMEGMKLEHDLMSRRDRLEQASAGLYRHYAKEVDIHATAMPEFAAAHRLPDGGLAVSLYRQDAASGQKAGDPFFHRIFSPEETKEVRIYLGDGNDVAVVYGPASGKNVVSRFIGGQGGNRFEDHTVETKEGTDLADRKINYVYDQGAESVFVTGRHSVVDRSATGNRDGQGDDNGWNYRKPRDTGMEVTAGLSTVSLNYSPDYGALAGWGVKVDDYGFNYAPYRYHAELDGAVAYGEDVRYRLRFMGDFRTLSRSMSLHLEAFTSTLDNMSYYGLGNETYYHGSDLSDNDFETRSNVTTLAASLRYPPRFARDYYWDAGIESKWITTDPEPGSFMDRNRSHIPGMDVEFTNNLHIGFHYDSRDSGEALDLSPRARTGRTAGRRPRPDTSALSGTTVDIEGKYYPEFLGNRSAFGKLIGGFRAYVPLSDSRYSRIAFRLGGQKNWGGYPYFEAAGIGGSNSIRGYDRNRFAGDAEVHASAELRFYGGQAKIFVPVLYGPLLFVDTGRVFVRGESSGQWHTGMGGGIWIAFFEPRYSAHLAIARGLDAGRLIDCYGIYAQAGFSF